MHLSRRAVLSGGAAAIVAGTAVAVSTSIAEIETRFGGRLGIAACDTGSGKTFHYRGGERFPLCSTFKFLAVADVLQRTDAGHERLDRDIAYRKSDLLSYAPITGKHAAAGAMSLGDLCAAAIIWSDNTAANLILRQIGGPSGLTRWLRGLGDPLTRLDRSEPALNSAIPGDLRDTTSPDAMLNDMQRILTGDALKERSRLRLADWMGRCQTASGKLHAGFPRDWRSGHKTGSGSNGTVNDIAIVWPPRRKPVLVAAYYTGSSAPADMRNHALAEAGRAIAVQFG